MSSEKELEGIFERYKTNSLRNDLAFDISWGCNVKDRKLLDTVMDRVMETIEAWEVRDAKKKDEELEI